MFLLLFFSILIIFTLFIRNHHQWGLYLILLLLPSYQIRLNILGIPSTLLEWMIIITAIAWLLPILRTSKFSWVKLKLALKDENKNNPIPRAFAYPIILFLIASWISVSVSHNTNVALGLWKAYFFEAIIFFIICVYLLTQKKYQTAINFLAGLVIVNGLFGAYQYFTGHFIPNPFWAQEIGRRIVGLYDYPNANSLLVAPLVPLFFVSLISKLKEKKYQEIILLGAAIILSLLTIYWSKSMGGAIGVAVSAFAGLLIYKKTRLATFIIMIMAVAVFPFTPLKQKAITTYNSTKKVHLPINPTSWQIRAQQWRETVSMLKESPIYGAGLGNYKEAVNIYHANNHIEIFLYPHNVFLNFWSEIGLVGLIAFIWLIIVFFQFCWQTYKINPLLTAGLACAMIALLVHGLVDVPYFKNDLALLFWFIVAGVIVIRNRK